MVVVVVGGGGGGGAGVVVVVVGAGVGQLQQRALSKPERDREGQRALQDDGQVVLAGSQGMGAYPTQVLDLGQQYGFPSRSH